MPTLDEICQRFIDRTREDGDPIGLYGTLDSAPGSGSSITDLTELGNTNLGPDHWLNSWIWLTEETGNNEVKPATTLVPATGVLSQGGGAYSSATGTQYYLLNPEWHPTRRLVPLVNQALERAWSWWRALLTLVVDGDMEVAATTNWTASNASLSKESAAADVWQGIFSLRVGNTGANGRARSDDFDAPAGYPVKFSAFVRITSGTARAKLVDASNSYATIQEKTASGVGGYLEIVFDTTIPGTVGQGRKLAVELGGDEADADTNWDDVSVMVHPITRVNGPAFVTEWVDDSGKEAFRLLRTRNVEVGEGSGPATAYGLDLVSPNLYQVRNEPAASNAVVFELDWRNFGGMYPLVIECRRPFSDFGALSAGSDSTTCPLNLVVAAMRMLSGPDNRGRAAFEAEQRRAMSNLRTPSVGGRNVGLAYRKMG